MLQKHKHKRYRIKHPDWRAKFPLRYSLCFCWLYCLSGEGANGHVLPLLTHGVMYIIIVRYIRWFHSCHVMDLITDRKLINVLQATIIEIAIQFQVSRVQPREAWLVPSSNNNIICKPLCSSECKFKVWRLLLIHSMRQFIPQQLQDCSLESSSERHAGAQRDGPEFRPGVNEVCLSLQCKEQIYLRPSVRPWECWSSMSALSWSRRKQLWYWATKTWSTVRGTLSSCFVKGELVTK